MSEERMTHIYHGTALEKDGHGGQHCKPCGFSGTDIWIKFTDGKKLLVPLRSVDPLPLKAQADKKGSES